MFNMAKRTAREKRHERTRDEILNAALGLILENGIDNLSMRELARRVDYSPAGLYEYFGGKDEIIMAVCLEGDSRLAAFLKAVPLDLPLREYLIELGLAYVRFARQNPEHFTVLFTNRIPGLTVLPDDHDVTHPEDSFSILLHAIKTGIADGLIVSVEGYSAVELSYSLWAMVHGMATLQVSYLRDLVLDFESADRHTLEIFITGLIR
jgi:AcrR family transcriptional regulator